MEENKEIVKTYQKDGLTVIWKPGMCSHSTHCWKGLIQVFNPRKKPWIDLEGATNERIKEQIEACPSGALSYKEVDFKAIEKKAAVELTCLKDGPIMITGDLQITNSDGTQERRSEKTVLCRCGASSNKPFCDGSHRTTNFKG